MSVEQAEAAKAVNKGLKADAGKPRFSLLPWEAVGDVVLVLEHGAKKYAVDNWRTVDNWRQRYFDACLRHLVAWRRGERFDVDSELPHLAHAACNVLFLLALEATSYDFTRRVSK